MLRLLAFVAEQGPPRNVETSHKIAGAIWEFIAGRVQNGTLNVEESTP
jgi:hypothetical protein